MKKNFRKVMALLLAAVMVLAMAVTVSAEGETTYPLSIYSSDGTLATNTYAVYQIATFDVEGTGNDMVYTNIVVNDAYTNYVTLDTLKTETDNSSNMKTLAETLAENVTDKTKVATVTEGTASLPKSGYYLIIETDHTSNDARIATRYILKAVDDSTEENKVTLKDSAPTVTKKIVLEDQDTETLVDKNVAAINDTVTYKIWADIPSYPSNATDITYKITDTMSNGLTYKQVTGVKIVSKPDDATEYESATDIKNDSTACTVSQNGQTVTVTLTSSQVLANGGKYVVVYLEATLDSDAVVGESGNPNSVNLEYTNDWNKETTYKTKPDTVITYTGTLTIEKQDSEEKDGTHEKLGGATFAIYSEKEYSGRTAPDGVAKTLEVGEKTYHYYDSVMTASETDGTAGKKLGYATLTGLDQGTYYAVETAAPTGYNKITDPQLITLSVNSQDENALETSGEFVDETDQTTLEAANSDAADYKVTWKVDDEDSTVTINNTKGTTLPGTGGIGSTIFTVGGIVLVLLAAMMFFVYVRRMKRNA